MCTRVRARDAKNKCPDPNGHPFFTAARFSPKCWKTLYCITQRVFMDGDGRGCVHGINMHMLYARNTEQRSVCSLCQSAPCTLKVHQPPSMSGPRRCQLSVSHTCRIVLSVPASSLVCSSATQLADKH